MRQIKFWKDDSRAIAEAVQARRAYFKVILKTKNELFFLRKWLTYYLKFLPPEAIVIFDNMSGDAEVLEYYDTLPEGIVVARYDGFHNFLHVINAFPALYNSLSRSSTYFGLFDSDEFLVRVDAGLTPETTTIVPFLRAFEPAAAFPCCWLTNMRGSETLFQCGINPSVLQGGLKSGKPIVNSGFKQDGIIHHNSQLTGGLFSASVPPELFLMHLKNLDPQQRIRANIEKLISRKVIPVGADVETAKSLDLTDIKDPVVNVYVNELHVLTRDTPEVSATLGPGMFDLKVGSPLGFQGEVERQVFETFLRPGPGGAVEKALLGP